MKLFLVFVIAAIAIALVFFMQKEEGVEPAGSQTTITPAPTRKPGLTVTPEPTKEAEPTKPAEPTATPEPTPTEVPEPPAEVSPEDAKALLEQKIDTGIYKIELLNDHLYIDGTYFYQFCVSENGTDMEPFLIVDKMDGTIWCYDVSGTIEEFVRFPVDGTTEGTETPTPSPKEGITAEQAYEVLCGYSKEKLGLAKEVKEYTPEYDSTLTLVKGVNCYRINLTEFSGGKVRNRGEFYVSTDGKKCFFIDSNLNEFVPVEK